MDIISGGSSVNLASPGPIGGTTPSTGAFTTVTATGAFTTTKTLDNELSFNDGGAGFCRGSAGLSADLALFSGGSIRASLRSSGAGDIGFNVNSTYAIGWVSGSYGTSLDTAFSRISAGVIGVGTGAAGSTAGTLRAAALSANGSDFTITAANSVSPTSPNRTITISYGGTTYYLAAKTTND